MSGLGDWSVEMFMAFRLKRQDVISPGDLAVRKGLAKLLKWDGKSVVKYNKVIQKRCIEETLAWSPYRTLAMMYLYRIVDI